MFESIKIASSTRQMLSDLVCAYIRYVARQSKITITELQPVRTLNEKHIKSIVHKQLDAVGIEEPEIKFIIELINEKVDVYKNYCDTVHKPRPQKRKNEAEPPTPPPKKRKMTKPTPKNGQ